MRLNDPWPGALIQSLTVTLDVAHPWPGPWIETDIPPPRLSRLPDRPKVLRRESDGALLLPVRISGDVKGWMYTIVSAEDAWAAPLNWFATPELYVYGNMDSKCKYLHRAIAYTALNDLEACPRNFFLRSATQIDHKDRYPLNNQRGNLRGCSNSVNNQNRNPVKEAPPGVSWDASRSMWQVRIKWRGSTHFGGRFTDLADASVAAENLRKRICKRYRKSFAKVQHLTSESPS